MFVVSFCFLGLRFSHSKQACAGSPRIQRKGLVGVRILISPFLKVVPEIRQCRFLSRAIGFCGVFELLPTQASNVKECFVKLSLRQSTLEVKALAEGLLHNFDN